MTRTPEQDELATTVRSLLAKRSTSAAVRAAIDSPTGYDESLWRLLCEQVGVAALPIREDAGGAGFSLVEALVVAEEVGYALAPLPLLSSLITSAALGVIAGSESLLEQIAAGEVATLASACVTSASATNLEPLTSRDGRVSGTIHHVLDGDLASVLVVAARSEDGVVLLAVETGDVDRTLTPAMDSTLRLATLIFDNVPATVLTTDATEALAAAHDAGCLVVAALQVGVARRGLDMTVAYAKDRVQFGRPIGSFQALKHRMADMLVRVEMATSALRAAAEDPSMIHSAAAYCSDALNQVAAETIQLHGGIGITWEHDAQLVFKRAHSLGQLFGQPHEHRALITL